MQKGSHRPVLLAEVVAALGCRPGGLWVDGTLGAGGHAEAILRATAPDGRLLGCDRDAGALERARSRLEPFVTRIALHHADHRRLPDLLDASGLGPANGILLDLGVSSLQLDDPERGFSFRDDGPLDMRMDRSEATTAADLVNRLPEKEIASLLARYGEEPAARRIARAIARERDEAPITTTTRLAAIVAGAIGRRGGEGRDSVARRGRPSRARRGAAGASPGRGPLHPATRTFQAVRIAVNRELEGLDRLLEEATLRLRPGGRIAVISFHSLEDRIVKRTFRALARRCICPRDLPLCACGRADLVRLPHLKPLRPGPEEIRDNPRSRSARLRVAERLAGGAP
ncbi:MAG TPA: 16S rRNA (cytosine(1402)-N(4))-methyltransferase RsmH [Candidatus Polarisedimenticolia bacterium]|nr:16S rRNA (cytosine(1402)-N(4))-methyltransferase RsmH [Candidatus Polarisedimenticolia bacterium]